MRTNGENHVKWVRIARPFAMLRLETSMSPLRTPAYVTSRMRVPAKVTHRKTHLDAVLQKKGGKYRHHIIWVRCRQVGIPREATLAQLNDREVTHLFHAEKEAQLYGNNNETPKPRQRIDAPVSIHLLHPLKCPHFGCRTFIRAINTVKFKPSSFSLGRYGSHFGTRFGGLDGCGKRKETPGEGSNDNSVEPGQPSRYV